MSSDACKSGKLTESSEKECLIRVSSAADDITPGQESTKPGCHTVPFTALRSLASNAA